MLLMSNLVKLNDHILTQFGQTAGEGFDFCELLSYPVDTPWGTWSASIQRSFKDCTFEATITVIFSNNNIYKFIFNGMGGDFAATVLVNGDKLKLEDGVEQGLVDTFLELTNSSDKTMVDEAPQSYVTEYLAGLYVSSN